MSSVRKTTTPAARRNPSRAAKAPRAVTGAPQRVRISPHGDQSGGAQAEPHEAADLSDEGSSDGDTSGADHGQLAGNEAALGDGLRPELLQDAPPTAALDGEAEATVLRVQERIDHELALQNEQNHPGDARGRFAQLGIRLASPRGGKAPSSDRSPSRVSTHGCRREHGVPGQHDEGAAAVWCDDGGDEAEDASKHLEPQDLRRSPGLAPTIGTRFVSLMQGLMRNEDEANVGTGSSRSPSSAPPCRRSARSWPTQWSIARCSDSCLPFS